jgi:phosphoglycolate phosphatase-like HAD superfamily hydrolase
MSIHGLVIFDFDGVLCDSIDSVVDRANSFIRSKELFLTATKDSIRSLENMDYNEFGQKIGVPNDLLAEFREDLISSFAVDENAIFEGLPDVIKMLSENVLCVNTNNSEENVQRFLCRYGIDRFFSSILTNTTHHSKSQRIVDAMDSFNVSETNTFMICDSNSDILAAKKAGCVSIAVTWGFQSPDTLRRSEPDYVVHNSIDILSAIHLHFSRRTKIG